MQNELLTPRQAASALGVSYPTIKSWIFQGKLKTVKTPGGHHRIRVNALRAYLEPQEARKRGRLVPQVSGRNQLVGTVTQIQIQGLLAKVVLTMDSQRVTAIITADAARELQLKKGDRAVALVKATEVMIARP